VTGLGNLLHETTHVSRPLVLTVLIHTGPQIHSRDGHFVAGERPVRDRFRMAQTFWADHRPLLLKEMWRRVPLDEKDGTSKIPSFERRVVFDRWSQHTQIKEGKPWLQTQGWDWSCLHFLSLGVTRSEKMLSVRYEDVS
jgi:hypothetical protein